MMYYTSNLNNDINNMLNAEHERDAIYPICNCCNEKIYSGKAWHIEDKWYCDYCEAEAITELEKMYKECI